MDRTGQENGPFAGGYPHSGHDLCPSCNAIIWHRIFCRPCRCCSMALQFARAKRHKARWACCNRQMGVSSFGARHLYGPVHVGFNRDHRVSLLALVHHRSDNASQYPAWQPREFYYESKFGVDVLPYSLGTSHFCYALCYQQISQNGALAARNFRFDCVISGHRRHHPTPAHSLRTCL